MNMNSRVRARRGGALKTILVVLVVLAAIGVLGWMIFLPTIVKRKVASLSGFPVEASSISANPFGASVRIENFQVRNPAEFPVADFVSLKLLDMKVKPLSVTSDRMDIPRLHLDLEKITIVTNKDGVTNATLFKSNVEKNTGETSESKPGSTTREQAFVIGDLVIRIGRIETVDYSKGGTPVTRTFPLGIDRHFTNVTDPKTVAGPIIADLLAANVSGIASGVTALLPKEYQAAFGDALQQAGSLLKDNSGVLKEQGGKALDTVKKLFDKLKGDGKP